MGVNEMWCDDSMYAREARLDSLDAARVGAPSCASALCVRETGLLREQAQGDPGGECVRCDHAQGNRAGQRCAGGRWLRAALPLETRATSHIQLYYVPVLVVATVPVRVPVHSTVPVPVPVQLLYRYRYDCTRTTQLLRTDVRTVPVPVPYRTDVRTGTVNLPKLESRSNFFSRKISAADCSSYRRLRISS
jgi:hypothetical protein